ncbi:hypothetical protein PTTG_27752 [Puccinia triticina 1-1 BBBD Race 1]|uniref:Uncharacterized protein n=1 Tax=Puccinia triticina (isolate 1-1 / race 1 (BBBD)) TaxID=630390 RepID=A0A180GIH4_PUCT1|nr:hypothetical protein PTTG_27752 [Puccinia triticina 1-1 BBBD Race 1]
MLISVNDLTVVDLRKILKEFAVTSMSRATREQIALQYTQLVAYQKAPTTEQLYWDNVTIPILNVINNAPTPPSREPANCNSTHNAPSPPSRQPANCNITHNVPIPPSRQPVNRGPQPKRKRSSKLSDENTDRPPLRLSKRLKVLKNWQQENNAGLNQNDSSSEDIPLASLPKQTPTIQNGRASKDIPDTANEGSSKDIPLANLPSPAHIERTPPTNSPASNPLPVSQKNPPLGHLQSTPAANDTPSTLGTSQSSPIKNNVPSTLGQPQSTPAAADVPLTLDQPQLTPAANNVPSTPDQPQLAPAANDLPSTLGQPQSTSVHNDVPFTLAKPQSTLVNTVTAEPPLDLPASGVAPNISKHGNLDPPCSQHQPSSSVPNHHISPKQMHSRANDWSQEWLSIPSNLFAKAGSVLGKRKRLISRLNVKGALNQ